MFDLAPSELPATATPPDAWTAERYLEALHPRDGRGVVGGLTIQGDQVRSHTWRREILAGATATMTEQEAYVAMNPYFGPRGGERRLAGLNALWLDLDIYRVPSLSALPRHEVPEHILSALREAGLPPPSMLIDSGRGFYCIWPIRKCSRRQPPPSMRQRTRMASEARISRRC